MDELLRELGLSDKETKTYLSCLEKGPSTIQAIAKDASLPRSSTYLIIEALIQKGLIYQTSQGKKDLFVASSPKKILEVLNEKKSRLFKLEEKLSLALPQFTSLYNSMPQKPKVSYFEGFEGIKNIFEETLTAREILVLCSGYNKPIEKKLSDYLDVYFEEVDKQKIPTFEIIGEGLDAKEYKEKYHGKLHQIRLTPRKEKFSHIDKMLYDNKIAIVSFVLLNGVVIENKEVADFEKELFWRLWEMSQY